MFFVDAAHFVHGTFLCCLWSFTRIFVRAASGRQRFNVLGAWNAVTRKLVAVTNTTVVNTETISADFRAAIEQTIAELPTEHATDLASLMTLNFPTIRNCLIDSRVRYNLYILIELPRIARRRSPSARIGNVGSSTR